MTIRTYPGMISALYARVSSEQQAEAATIDSQVASIEERMARDGLTVGSEMRFLDEEYSGATLIRPALERLRDAAASGAVDRFRTARQVGAYAGLTARVHQSGEHCHRGSITRQGSPWLRWILVQAAMHAVRDDPPLKNFYTRVRKRSSAKIARVATARKLAEICWKRLRRWQALHASHAA
jgi:hypothetical protein